MCVQTVQCGEDSNMNYVPHTSRLVARWLNGSAPYREPAVFGSKIAPPS
jgi:hypothetical protein